MFDDAIIDFLKRRLELRVSVENRDKYAGDDRKELHVKLVIAGEGFGCDNIVIDEQMCDIPS